MSGSYRGSMRVMGLVCVRDAGSLKCVNLCVQGNRRALPARDAGSWGREGAHADGGR